MRWTSDGATASPFEASHLTEMSVVMSLFDPAGNSKQGEAERAAPANGDGAVAVPQPGILQGLAVRAGILNFNSPFLGLLEFRLGGGEARHSVSATGPSDPTSSGGTGRSFRYHQDCPLRFRSTLAFCSTGRREHPRTGSRILAYLWRRIQKRSVYPG